MTGELQRYIASAVGNIQERVHFILTEDLAMRKLLARWVPRILIADQKHIKQNMSHAKRNLFGTDPGKLLLRFVTKDETWVHHFTKQ